MRDEHTVEPQNLTNAQDTQEACRMNARGVIMEKVERLRRDANNLEELARSLPDNLHRDADEALWQLVCFNR